MLHRNGDAAFEWLCPGKRTPDGKAGFGSDAIGFALSGPIPHTRSATAFNALGESTT